MAHGTSAGQQVKAASQRPNLPPRVVQAQRFLAQRGWRPGHTLRGATAGRLGARTSATRPAPQAGGGSGSWQAVGPVAVTSPNYGPVTGRISALALDPSDTSGNTLYVGTTGGGVWQATTAGNASLSSISFTPLTDDLVVNINGQQEALSSVEDSSISIGALTVQPGGTGVILAGTGDPNDALDSYYGAGILRSADGGTSWSLIAETQDAQDGLSNQNFSFAGEGIAGFAWSTSKPQLVVAAVSQAYEGTLVNAVASGASYQGLYYSSDAGTTWHLATITDGNGADVQGPADPYLPTQPDGNAATSVVWNRWRNLFVAAVRFHGYYQSTDGVTWTRMAAQPGAGLTTLFCPNRLGSTGSPACPIFRGTLAVNPQTGDTFAWTVDAYNQDQGLWMDQCSLSGSSCGNQSIAFAQQLNTSTLETDDILRGPATIENGDYTLALAAVPSGQETIVLAGDQDLWKCSVTDSATPGCVWRNTTNSTVGFCAQVAEYQHVLAWNTNNSLEIFVGNDGGLWRSLDAIGETGQVCASTDATHFQNLNGSLGSLAEVVSMSQSTATPYSMMTGLGVNGTAGVKSETVQVGPWPTVLGGEGGPVAIDPLIGQNWYVNNGAGVSIQRCAQSGACTAATSGSGSSWTTVVDDADTGEDGLTMTVPANFLVDSLDPSQLLVGTCRVWRGPADGSGWSGSNAISPILDNQASIASCNGDALIRTMASMEIPGGEVVYAGMYGAADGGAILAGHVFGATISASSSTSPAWPDLTLNPVTEPAGEIAMNAYGWDISSIFIDPHDTTGQTVYVTVEGIAEQSQAAQAVYRSTDGGAHWANLTSNRPWHWAPANSVLVDPQDANTVYVATDAGVYATQQIASCANQGSACWTAFGTGLPEAPVIQLSSTPATSSAHILIAATYGRGVWQMPLLTASEDLTTATVTPSSLSFGVQINETQSSSQPVTLLNTGSTALTPTAISASGDFNETDNCLNAIVSAGATCTLQVAFKPIQSGSRTGQLTIGANVPGGQLTVSLGGTGIAPGVFSFNPAQWTFPSVTAGQSSTAQPVIITNSGGSTLSGINLSVSLPFHLTANNCPASLDAGDYCTVEIVFSPTANGEIGGDLTVSSTSLTGVFTVPLNGLGGVAGSVDSQPESFNFAVTGVGVVSTPTTVTVTNTSSTVELNNLALSATPVGVFNVVNNQCTSTLAPLASCSAGVDFAPTSAGQQSGTLTIASSSLTASKAVPLSGTGFDFSIAASGSTSQNVANGQSASYLLTAALLNQTAGATITLQCGSTSYPIPTNATCTFNPSASITVGATASSSVTVIITTGQAQSSVRTRGATGWRMLPLVSVLLLPLGWRRRRSALWLAALLAFMASGVTSCTSSGIIQGVGSPTSGAGTTPSGLYSIAITATSNNVQHALVDSTGKPILTLTVD
jgi:hypothetical protein